MKVINARNVNEALHMGINEILNFGEQIESRVGDTLEIPEPVATVYSRPWERVLISHIRDANPFFHMMEAMWILAGREDVKFLAEFNKRMVEFSDDGETFNAAYGYRLRKGNKEYCFNQLAKVIEVLQKDPNSRQAVCQIWDEDDLYKTTKDKACNMSIVFRIRSGKLTMTVNNRSNDMLWGAYGANAVQFSMIQEYVAAHLDLAMGEYTQISNSFHVYTTGPGGELWNKLKDNFVPFDYDGVANLSMRHSDMGGFEHDLLQFFSTYDRFDLSEICELNHNLWLSSYFTNLILPMLSVFCIHKNYGANKALLYIHRIQAEDWRLACKQWLTNRLPKTGA